MSKSVILITGTPCVGKTTVANQLTTELDALYINLTDLANKHNLTIGEDQERKTTVIDEEKMRRKIGETINTAKESNIIVDGHYAPTVVPKRYVTRIFVLRRNPIELRSFMEKCGFSETKLRENLAAEILDVCLIEALRAHKKEKVCELDITGKTVENISRQIIAIKDKREKCIAGCVDWLGMLEKQGLVGEYLKI
jgi:adenylate kinase